MKIGFMQFAPVLGDTQATLEIIDGLIVQAKDADLLVLPELCNSGYNFQSAKQAWAASEEIPSGIFVRHLETLCQRYGLHLVSGLNERDGDRLYNSAVLVGPQGIIGRYRKLHLFLNEKDYFQPGDVGLPVFDIGSCKVGMLVCFDWIFPEVWRALMLQGADIICHPSNLVLPGLAQQAVPIHALVNRLFVVTGNRIGSERDLVFTGLSTIASPKGEVLAQGSSTGEQVLTVDVDIMEARNKDITARNNLLADRRPETYHILTAANGGSEDH